MIVAPRFRIAGIEFFERDVRLRMPFRFGVVTLTEAPQAFVRAKIVMGDGRESIGMGAELLAPKWFDKNLALTNEENFDQLRMSLEVARDLYMTDPPPRTAFGRFASAYLEQRRRCEYRGLNPLIASFGLALINRAIIDALCRGVGLGVDQAVRRNLLGIDARMTPDLQEFDISRFLSSLRLAPAIHARHTVGLVDAVTEADISAEDRLEDGLPQSLDACVKHYGLTNFKLKVGGNREADLERLSRIASVLDRIEQPYYATLDGNEQYGDVDAVIQLWRAMEAEPRLARLRDAILFIEQPISRVHALEHDISTLAALRPVEIDESDATIDAFVQARELGYSGVSSKSCKGIYKSILNAARCAHWNAQEGRQRFFMSAEDLTTQAGLGVQQDLALASLIGCTHVERNGHHYVNGFAGLSNKEQEAFLQAHPDLYHRENGVVRLRISEGKIALGTLQTPGFASGAMPDVATLRPCSYGDL